MLGSGTIEDPYKIEKIEDLVSLSEQVNSGKTYNNKYFELTDKLDFYNDESYKNPEKKYDDINEDGKIDSIKAELTTGNGFKPIANSEQYSFEGIFKGNDKSIVNVRMVKNGTDNLIGLFGNNKGTVSNLKVSGNITINANVENVEIYIGMLVAKNKGLIQSCDTEGEINVISNNTSTKVAGITAENSGKVIDSASGTNIVSDQTKAGIIAENNVLENVENSGEITNCTNTGTIQENAGTDFYTAGVVANNRDGNITNCNNNGEIVGRKVGGVVGISTGYIVACQNTGSIKNVAEDSNNLEVAGGIVGTLEIAKLENCKNTGTISGITNIGGIVGQNRGTIIQCKNEGEIFKIANVIAQNVNIGGVVGKNDTNSKLSNSKNSGSINSETDNLINMGGICGIFYNNSLIETCENNGQIVGAAQTVNPNNDIDNHCISCSNNGTGNIQVTDFGELNVGVIYGKYEEK